MKSDLKRIFDDKKAGEKILSIWWFFVLAVIGAGIVGGVLMYYSAEIDVKEIEANILYERITDCITRQGFLQEEVLKNNFDVFKECWLDKDIFIEKRNFYFKIKISDEQGKSLIEGKDYIEGGLSSLEGDCVAVSFQKIKAKHYPRCAIKKDRALYYKNNEIKVAVVEILTASNQIGEKIPTYKT